MNISEAKSLIEKFLNGTTTLEEEYQFGEFLMQSNNLPDDLLPYKQMFAYFEGGMTDNTLLAGLDNKQDASKKVVTPKSERKRNITLIATMTAAAAVMFGILFTGLQMDKDEVNGRAQYTQTAKEIQSIDSVSIETDSLLPNSNECEKKGRRQSKWHYKPAPSKTYLAKSADYQQNDSINKAATLMADNEIKKIEEQQQYVINLLNAIDIINAAEIASVADDEDVY